MLSRRARLHNQSVHNTIDLNGENFEVIRILAGEQTSPVFFTKALISKVLHTKGYYSGV
jgi:hypothetical protein